MQNKKSNKTLGNLILLLTALIWGTSFVFQKEGVTALEPFTFGSVRCFLAAISVGIVAYIFEHKKERSKEYKKNSVKGGLICGLFLTAACNFQQLGMIYTSAGKSAFITALYMLLIPIFGLLFFRKKISIQEWIAVVIGIVGMYFLCISGSSKIVFSDMYLIACAAFFAFQMLSADHFTRKASPLIMSAIQFAVNAILSGIIALIFESPNLDAILAVSKEILYCGLISGGAGYTLQMIGQSMTDPTTAGLLCSFESVFGALAGALLLSERMSMREITGALIMFAAIILVQIPSKNKNDSQ